MADTDKEMRQRLAELRDDWHRELSNISLAAAWPEIERLVVALSFNSAERRADALDVVLEHLVRHVAAARKQLRATDRWLATEAKKAAAAEEARKTAAAVKLRAAG